MSKDPKRRQKALEKKRRKRQDRKHQAVVQKMVTESGDALRRRMVRDHPDILQNPVITRREYNPPRSSFLRKTPLAPCVHIFSR